MEQILLRGWRRLAAPMTGVSKLLVQEFYANTAVSDEKVANEDQLPYMSFVRGIKVDFSPENIRRVMRFKTATVITAKLKKIKKIRREEERKKQRKKKKKNREIEKLGSKFDEDHPGEEPKSRLGQLKLSPNMTLKKASKETKLTAVTFGPRLKRGPNVTHQDLTKLSQAHRSHVWPTFPT
ncbi:hypothetical protein PIB30_095002 [Stylosanthes scabra]|uniref:Uncharacterized protein n=1 Tax=Stylosanthes scabra TaxID=79078 RepID=A0ABU6QV36_9FABA|nr:hypothetical protein [Stylosanthes scabra]